MIDRYHLLNQSAYGLLENTFSGQFKNGADGISYRYCGVGLPVSVTAEERDISIADYEQRHVLNVRISWILLALILGISLYIYRSDPQFALTVTFGFGFVIAIIYTRLETWLWQRVETARFGAASAHVKQSRICARDAKINNLSWWTIAVPFFLGSGWLAEQLSLTDMSGRNWYHVIGGLVLVIIHGRYAYQRLRLRAPLTP
jgi:hypothetical protein